MNKKKTKKGRGNDMTWKMEDLSYVFVMWPNCDFVLVCYTNFDEFMIGMYDTKIKLEKRMKQCRSLCRGLCLNYLILNHNDRLDVVSARDNRASKIHASARDWEAMWHKGLSFGPPMVWRVLRVLCNECITPALIFFAEIRGYWQSTIMKTE